MAGGHGREPIKHTCPDIDKYIKIINQTIYKSSQLTNMDEGDLLYAAESLNSQLINCIEWLEGLRSSNSTLREWGVKEAIEVDRLDEEINSLYAKMEV